jgi:hypothetical protein
MGRGLRQQFAQHMGNRPHSRAPHPHRGPPPPGGVGGYADQGYTTTSAGSQGGPRQGCGRWGGVDERRVGPADVRRSVRRAARPTVGRQRRRTRGKRGRAIRYEVTRRAVVRPCSCLLGHPAPRHAMGHGRRRACRHGLGVVMSRGPASWGPWVTPPPRCPAAPTLSRLGPALTACALHGACRPSRRPGRHRGAPHPRRPRRLLGGPRTRL